MSRIFLAMLSATLIHCAVHCNAQTNSEKSKHVTLRPLHFPKACRRR